MSIRSLNSKLEFFRIERKKNRNSFVFDSDIMRYQNRLMSNEDDSLDPQVIVDTSETTPSPLTPAFFTRKNPIFIPSLFGFFGVVCVLIILCRIRLYRIIIRLIYGDGFYQRKSSNSRLRTLSKHRQYHPLSSLSKP